MTLKTGKVRLKDIALETGYSISTVAKVMSGMAKEARIAENTEKEIIETAKRLGYVPNIMARNLRSKRSGLIGIHLATADDSIIASTLTSILQILPGRGYAPILTVEEADYDRQYDTWIRNEIEGLLVCGPTKILTAKLLEELHHRSIPVVAAGNPYKSPGSAAFIDTLPTVQINNRKGIHLAIDHLREIGRTCIAFINGPDWHSDADERCSVYKDIIRQWQEPLVADIVDTQLYWQRGYQSAELLLKDNNDIDALMAYDDNVALGAMKYCADHDISIPDDIAVVGFDNQPQALYAIPSLTTVDQPAGEIGRKSLELLERMISGSSLTGKRVYVEPHLIIRTSTSGIHPALIQVASDQS